jgi:hypothetical protein
MGLPYMASLPVKPKNTIPAIDPHIEGAKYL